MKLKPRKSLRTILVSLFLLFAVVPLAFITGFSLVKYEQAIDQELSQRLEGNARELEIILKDFEESLVQQTKRHVRDKSLIYYSSQNAFSKVRELLEPKLLSGFAHRTYMFQRDGALKVALFKNSNGQIERQQNLEGGDIVLAEELLEKIQLEGQLSLLDVKVSTSKARENEIFGQLELSIYSPIESVSGVIVGYIEETLHLDQVFLENTKNRMDVELLFFKEGGQQILSSHQDLIEYKSRFFQEQLNTESDAAYFDLTLRNEPYRFMIEKIQFADTDFFVGLGASKSSARSVLEKVKDAFLYIVLTLFITIVICSFVVSKVILRPLYDVLGAIKKADFDKGGEKIESNNDTELGLLVDSFNEMSEKIYQSRRDLKGKISELETANLQIKETQARLIHTGKMASLGQLVAGVAHELNNPIGFIYSNMTHLKEYSEKLVELVNVAEKKPKTLAAAKEEADFDYIVEDMPKLIGSCEDGARRTRDIVLGLRNFSRLEEAQMKEVDIEESLRNTLRLLSGELKNRIQVEEVFEGIPQVTCYPSQLNQVFMNILSNAAQAIEGEGKITLRTRKVDNDKVAIDIEDTGKGMDEETRQKIFDPFFTTKGLGTGTGLGLSISYGVIQKHDGEIKVISELGAGTKFTVILPIMGPEE